MVSKIAKFLNYYLDGVTDLHTRHPFICKCHLMTIFADVFPYFSASFRILGWFKTSYPVVGGPEVREPSFNHGRSAEPNAL